MIVSDAQSLLVRLILGGVLAACAEGRLSPEADRAAAEFIAWCVSPGVTAEAAEEFSRRPFFD